MIAGLRRAWVLFRELTGDDAYERYLRHWRDHHASGGGEPLDRAAFYRDEQRRKWDGVRRCC
ncbi:MAG TPA: YbdD/YjiX family protein [Gammaproteobacteria bacterium]